MTGKIVRIWKVEIVTCFNTRHINSKILYLSVFVVSAADVMFLHPVLVSHHIHTAHIPKSVKNTLKLYHACNIESVLKYYDLHVLGRNNFPIAVRIFPQI
jgi:hypothetical protein